MTQITIDIPDDLAQQLAPYQSHFSDLFTQLIAKIDYTIAIKHSGQTISDNLVHTQIQQHPIGSLQTNPINRSSLYPPKTLQELPDSSLLPCFATTE